MPQRTEPRIAKQAEIRVFGMDSQGRPVNLPAKTVDISKHGARVEGVRCWDAPGEMIGIRHGTEKARYRVVWIGPPGTPVEGQIGVECVEAGKYIFGVPAAVASDSQRLPLGPGAARMPVRQVGLMPMVKTTAEVRRHNQRFAISGSANVREVGRNVPQWATLQDISSGGCYLETMAPLPVFTRIELTLHIGDIKVDATGTVVAKHPLVGMGIKFTDMSPLNRQRLMLLVGKLERTGAPTADSAD